MILDYSISYKNGSRGFLNQCEEIITFEVALQDTDPSVHNESVHNEFKSKKQLTYEIYISAANILSDWKEKVNVVSSLFYPKTFYINCMQSVQSVASFEILPENP